MLEQLMLQIRDPIWDQIGIQIQDRTRFETWSEIQIRYRIWDQIRFQIGNQIGNKIEKELTVEK